MRIEPTLTMTEKDIEWCYMRATRLRVPIGDVMSEMVAIGITMTDGAEQETAARDAKGADLLTMPSVLTIQPGIGAHS